MCGAKQSLVGMEVCAVLVTVVPVVSVRHAWKWNELPLQLPIYLTPISSSKKPSEISSSCL